ncbi:MAG TPA: tRNA 2-selenouridine(34) synthase MnmH [Ideonella sp.]|nr:tRNA 2-selenouridine(34) synthase MnmH [Ideonella sp.]
MSLATVTATDALGGQDGYDAVIDVRSPSEFTEDRLPGAVNWPVLDDAERAEVGTIYTQVSTFEARKRGAAVVSRNIARLIEEQVAGMPRDWRPLVYCWRGGQRSGSLAIVLAQIGFRTRQLQGGYKAFRAVVREELAAQPARFDWRVIGGRTGSGKTRLLGALSAEGAQVLDLEGLAAHRGSVLGDLPGRPQPSQKAFETGIWQVLRALDPARPVFVESESRRIGRLQLPDALLETMRQRARPVMVELPLEARVRLLREDYAFFTEDVDALCERLQPLTELRGKASVAHWQSLARSADWPGLLAELMQQHYDPLYDHALKATHEARSPDRVALPDAEPATLAAAARQLMAG